MRRTRAAMAVGFAVLLVTTTAAPTMARRSVGIAEGSITWTGQTDLRPGRVSDFWVQDGKPGRASDKDDGGWYHFSEVNATYDQEMTMRIECVRVRRPWAEFAGVITEATGNFNVGNVFLVSVLDTDEPEPDGFYIGMKSYGNDIDAACDAALDDLQRTRRGTLTGGYVDVRSGR